MRRLLVLVWLHALSACSLVDAFTGDETPFNTIERVRPNGRSIFTLAARGKMIAASGGPDVTFLEHRGSNNYAIGNQIGIPQPTAMAMGNFNGMPGDEVVALTGAGIDVVSQDGQIQSCPVAGGLRVVTGDLDFDGLDDIAVLQGQDVSVFFGAPGPSPGLDCATSGVVPLGAIGRAITFATTKSGARLFVLGETDLMIIDPSGVQGTFSVSTLAGVVNGGTHVAVADVDADGMRDLLTLDSARQLTVRFRTAETFMIQDEVDNIAIDSIGATPTGLVRFGVAGSPDGIAISRMNPGGIDIVLDVDDGGVSEISGAYNSAVTQVFATDLNGDQIEDLISDGENGDIVVALSSGD